MQRNDILALKERCKVQKPYICFLVLIINEEHTLSDTFRIIKWLQEEERKLKCKFYHNTICTTSSFVIQEEALKEEPSSALPG